MAEDIHVKIYIKSKVGNAAGKYVSAMEVMSSFVTGNDDFKDTFNYRSKQVFSIFGSTEGEWAKMPQLNSGMPDWLMQNFPTESARLKMKKNNYYGFSWITHRDLRKGLVEYHDALCSVEKYYKKFEDDEAYEPLKQLLDGVGNHGYLSSEGEAFVKNWRKTAQAISEKLVELYKHLTGLEEKYGGEDFRELFDIEDTVYLFWFDS